MYAAAGGASLASRQARQRQRQEKKTLQAKAKLHPPKASDLSVAEHGASTPTRTSRQFHQLPTTYLRAPPSQGQGRKLSTSYTAQSKLLLPIDEGDTQSVLHMRGLHAPHMHHSHSHAHPHQQQHFSYTGGHTSHHHGRVSPKLVHRHSGSSGTSFHHTHLPKSATATLPLVSQMEATPPTTPAGAVVVAKATSAEHDAIVVPHHDSIIVTPATPLASPGHVVKHTAGGLDDDLPEAAAEKQPLTAVDSYDDDEPMHAPAGPLERKCSVYRMRRSDAFENDSDVGSGIVKRQLKELQFIQHQQQYEPLLIEEPTPPPIVFKGIPNGRKWQTCAYCEEGICVCEHIECAQGRAAWLERGRRCSVQESQAQAAACHRRWVKRNRIQDASLGGSSDDEDFLGVLRGPSTFANAFLYVGLGTIALGLVIAFVGTGEKGFKTVELRLIGPSLIGLGLICCILRILFCICPSHCISSHKKARKKNGNKVDADHTTSLLRGESKRVSIARGPAIQPKYPITHKRSNSKMLNEGMEALRQIATTSLFMQNEQKPTSLNRVVPIIKEPENPIEAPLEMKKLETALNVCEISDEEDEDEDNARFRKAKTITSTKTPAKKDATAKTAGTKATPSTGTTRSATATTGQPATTSSKTATTSTTVNEKPPSLSSSAGKLARQRVSLRQKPPPQPEPVEQSHSLSSSSTVKDSIDDDQLLMETSLMVIKPAATVHAVTEARPPSVPRSSTAGAALGSSISSTGATPRLNQVSTKTSTAATMTTTTTSSALPPPPTYTGAISRSSQSSYDLPPAQPHTYAAAAASARSSGIDRGEILIRGPLGMPLSALTASCSTYALPSSASARAASATATTTTTTTVSLLPLPAPPPKLTTAPSTANQQQHCIPGQVMDTAPSTSYSARLSSPHTGATATTSLSITLPPTTSKTPAPAPKTSTPAIASVSFKFPAPLTSSSASSSASSNGRSAAASSSMSGTGIGKTLVLPLNASKFEPELVLSPAKLGQ